MRAEPEAQLLLLDLQDLDTKLGQLAHRRAAVPQIATLAQMETRAAQLRDREVAIRTVASDLEREQTRAEADVAQVRARMARDRALLDAGSVASARQLGDLQREIESLGRRVVALEDVELELMEKLEDAQTRAQAVADESAELERDRQVAERERDAAFADVDAEAERAGAQRARVASEIPADLLALYDKIRAGAGGLGAAALHQGRCQGCQLTLPPADLAQIRSAAAEEVVRCEECRRILVRTRESGL